MQKEQAQFEYCKGIIEGNIRRYEAEYQLRHMQVQEFHKQLNSGDEGAYNQLMTAASLEEHAFKSMKKNEAALLKPYFGRVDYVDHATEK